MLRLVLSNQRGGVGKTTTAVTLGSLLAADGKRTLIIDTDPQGSVHTLLALKPDKRDLYAFVIEKQALDDCIIEARKDLFIMAATRRTVEAEGLLMGQTAREYVFVNTFGMVDRAFDAVLVDVAPSISLLQTCAMMYTKNVLVPVTMEPLSLQGAGAALYTIDSLNKLFGLQGEAAVKAFGFLPVAVNKRLSITQTVSSLLDALSKSSGVQVLPGIRTDQSVMRSFRDHALLSEVDPKSKALEDYAAVLNQILTQFGMNYAHRVEESVTTT